MKTHVISVVMLVACMAQVLGQGRQVSGKVICSEDGIPLFAVSISIEGTTFGAITGEHGEFSMNVPVDCPALVFHYLGMKTKRVELGNKKDMPLHVIMEQDVFDLPEVTIAYNRQTHLSQRYMAVVKKDTLEKIPPLFWAEGFQPDEEPRALR
jgi:hypothetical protein